MCQIAFSNPHIQVQYFNRNLQLYIIFISKCVLFFTFVLLLLLVTEMYFIYINQFQTHLYLLTMKKHSNPTKRAAPRPEMAGIRMWLRVACSGKNTQYIFF